MDNNQNQDPNNINIQLNEMVAAGAYANLALVNHSPSEFVLDFIQIMPGVQQAQVRSRVILAYNFAKEEYKHKERSVVSVKKDPVSGSVIIYVDIIWKKLLKIRKGRIYEERSEREV